jgi:type IV secretion system protein VirB1
MDLSAVIQQCTPSQVSTQTMSAIMRVESAHRPHAIGYKIIRKSDRKVFELKAQPRDKEEAVAWAKWFEQNGFRYDAGSAQVHSLNFSKYGLTPETAFDSCQNIRAGALILHDCYSRALPKYKDPQIALRHALSCYQSGNFSTGFATGYVSKVVGTALKSKNQ